MAFTQAFEAAGSSGSQGTLVTAGASANTLAASYTQLIAASGFAYQGFTVFIHQSSPTSSHEKYILWIAKDSGPEVDIVPFMFSMRGNGLEGPMIAYIPLAIAAGTRVSANLQCTTGSGTVRMMIFANQTNVDGDNASYFGRATAYGLDAATSGGQALDAGGTVNTKGAYTLMTASCTNPVDAFYLMVAVNTAGKTYAGSTDTFHVDIAINTGPEVVVVNDIPIGAGDTNAAYYRPWLMGPYRVNQIAAGTRLSARCKSTTNNAGDRVFHASLLALDQITNPAASGGAFAGGRQFVFM